MGRRQWHPSTLKPLSRRRTVDSRYCTSAASYPVGSRLLDQKRAGKAGYGAAVIVRLADALRVDYVMVHTDKIDLYGRYVAQVFYAPGETDKRRIVEKGACLNQRLLDEGLAKAL